jgi:hypothetical protein
MKRCIWCLKTEEEETFEKIAHIIPQSLKAKKICKEVCDNCNDYFGNHRSGTPQIEVMLKETFFLSRLILLDSMGEIGKNKALPKPNSSIFFKINTKNRSIKLKSSFKTGFKQKMCRQFKRGIYKVYLENNQTLNGNSHDKKFDFIRQFARHNFGDCPVVYSKRKYAASLDAISHIKYPEILETKDCKEMVNNFNVYEFKILSHQFAIPLISLYELTLDKYLKNAAEKHTELLYPPKLISDIREINLAWGH